MSPRRRQERDFEERQLYQQWLYRRDAPPLALNRHIVKWLWVLLFVFLVADDHRHSYVGELLAISSSIAVAAGPPLLVLVDFLYHAPTAVFHDRRSGMMDFVFSSPLPTGDIVSGLRRFIARQNLVKLAPTATLAVVALLEGGQLAKWQDWVMLLASTLMVYSLWWFLLESGVVTAALPRFVASTGLTFLIWVVPVVVAVLWGGQYIADCHWHLWFGDIDIFNVPEGVSWKWVSFLWEAWFLLHYSLLLFIPTLFLHLISPRVMDAARRGQW